MLKAALALILTVSFTGCHGRNIDSIRMGEWISLVINRAGIVPQTAQTQYFISIGPENSFYGDIQAAAAWGILDPSRSFDPDQPLTREWTAFTLVNLAKDLNEGSGSQIKDISKSLFPVQVATAVSSGLMKTDGRSMFYPKEVIEREEAEKCLNEIISYINNRTFDQTEYDVSWLDDMEIRYCATEQFDEENQTAVLSGDETAVPGEMLCLKNSDGYGLYSVESSAGSEVVLNKEDPDEYLESFHFKGSKQIDFTQAVIYDPDGNLIMGEETGFTSGDHIRHMAELTNTKRFEISGYACTVKTSSHTCNIEFSKKLNDDTKIYGGFKMSQGNADFDISRIRTLFTDSYWTFSFETQETLGVRTEYKKKYEADLSGIDTERFLADLNSLCAARGGVQKAVLNLLSIHIPIPEIPFTEIVLDLSVDLKTTGKAELVLSQKNKIGYEISNDGFRLIKESANQNNSSIKADVSLTADVSAALKSGFWKLTDLHLKSGAKADMKAKVHFFDDEGQMHTTQTDADADIAEELASTAKDIMVCVDAGGNWILEAEMNSKDTELGKAGYEMKQTILDASNAPLFERSPQHFENGQAVPSCTRKSREKTAERDNVEVKGTIKLSSYALSVHCGQKKSLSILGLPDGYTAADLSVTSSDPSVAVCEGLTVTGISSGSAVIAIRTKDGLFETYCNILVPQEKAQ